MKAVRGAFPAALDKPDPRFRLYLFSGPDDAGSRLLATRLLHGLAAEKVSFSGAQLKADPALLVDEAAAISMFGRRLLWIEPAGEEILPAVEALLAAPQVESPTVVLVGQLKKGSVLGKLVDGHPAALSHISYVPEGRDAVRVVIEAGRELGLRLSPPLAERVSQLAAGDQQIARQELGKFALYLDASAAEPKNLTDEVVDMLSADASESDIGRAGDLALSGDVAGLADELVMATAGTEAIPIVRALQRRLLQLTALRARLDGGQSLDAVLASVWRRDQPMVRRALPAWSAVRLAEVFELIQDLERQILLTPVGDRDALGHTLLRIARAARR